MPLAQTRKTTIKQTTGYISFTRKDKKYLFVFHVYELQTTTTTIFGCYEIKPPPGFGRGFCQNFTTISGVKCLSPKPPPHLPTWTANISLIMIHMKATINVEKAKHIAKQKLTN